jgi:methylmalonyl-CoA mutase N-terminal domain/subunit
MPLDVYEGSSGDLVAQQTVSASITVVDPTEGAGAVGSTAATIARNAAKSIATITIPAAAGKLVTITIENVKTGATKTYYRKAAAVTGVAKFTLRKAGKWEVFASYSNLVTDTVKLKK